MGDAQEARSSSCNDRATRAMRASAAGWLAAGTEDRVIVADLD